LAEQMRDPVVEYVKGQGISEERLNKKNRETEGMRGRKKND